MKTLNFKTNLTDGTAVAAVTPLLNDLEPIDGWNVDTAARDHRLTVQTIDNRIVEKVRQVVENAGYRAEFIPDEGNGGWKTNALLYGNETTRKRIGTYARSPA